MKFTCGLAIVLAAGLTGAGALAQENEETPAMPDGCAVTSQSDVIRLVLCEAPEMLSEQLIEAGRAACGAALPCGAWIWPDAMQMPEVAPPNHDGLTPEQITASYGVWVAEQQNLIVIDKE